MSRRRHPRPSSRSKLLGGWLFGAAAMIAAALISPKAQAAEPLGAKLFDALRFDAAPMSWHLAPPLRLQPESARLVLFLPPEWMPEPDFGFLGVPLDPNKHWEFHRDQRMTRATLGASVRLEISDPSRSIDFGLRLMPRAAIAVLRFDPTARLH